MDRPCLVSLELKVALLWSLFAAFPCFTPLLRLLLSLRALGKQLLHTSRRWVTQQACLRTQPTPGQSRTFRVSLVSRGDVQWQRCDTPGIRGWSCRREWVAETRWGSLPRGFPDSRVAFCCYWRGKSYWDRCPRF